MIRLVRVRAKANCPRCEIGHMSAFTAVQFSLPGVTGAFLPSLADGHPSMVREVLSDELPLVGVDGDGLNPRTYSIARVDRLTADLGWGAVNAVLCERCARLDSEWRLEQFGLEVAR